MGFKTVELIFKMGKFLAVTPSSTNTKNESFSQQIYILCVFVFFVLASISSLIENNFFKEDNPMKFTMAYIVETVLDGFNFYTMITLNFSKRSLWFDLFRNLSKKIKVESSGGKKLSGKISFFVSNAIYGVFLSYCSCLWFTHIQWSFFARYGLRELQIYVQFFFKLLTNEILKMFLVRYKRLNSLLKTHLSYRRRLKNISKTIPLKLIRQTVTHMIFLRTTQEMFNDLFGWPLLLIVAYTTVQFLNAILFMFSDVPFSPSETFILLGGRFATITVVTVRMILLCDDVSREARKIFLQVYQIRWLFEDASPKQRKELYELTEVVGENLPEFTAAGFFHIGRSNLLSVLETSASFLMVVLQFSIGQNKDKHQ